ncbi:hypothetical protein V5D56_02080 [Cellulosimicrobium sp. PMB13]|uniref:hypothetical protein n=1 Tax=Cellulosimicrobium sp. PMB13 TaxID=3120158 RepID=UPI003F4C232E
MDTETLALAAALTAGAAGALLAVGGPEVADGAADATVAGDPALAGAVAGLLTAWGPARRLLLTELDQLAAALRETAALLDGAEAGTARRLAEILVPPGAVQTLGAVQTVGAVGPVRAAVPPAQAPVA